MQALALDGSVLWRGWFSIWEISCWSPHIGGWNGCRFSLGAGLALVIGAILNYVVAPAGNPKFLFGGVLLIWRRDRRQCAGLPWACRRVPKAGTKGMSSV